MQVSLDPAIDHSKFRVYSGFGQQLGPIVLFGAAGVIDGLSAFYPKTVVKLMNLILLHIEQKKPIDLESLGEMQRLQFVISQAEEFIGKFGVIGIKEATYRVTGVGSDPKLDFGRLPLKGKVDDGDWEKWHAALLSDIEKVESSLP